MQCMGLERYDLTKREKGKGTLALVLKGLETDAD